ncbi:ATP-binding protein [Cupriavidus sp. AU9028]|uniref:ATP-binding protein n=1 Tax=Cupriavidus sp. AU9028 TaxID=2871157 RepID=UPI001C94940B|nr:ATP-binding protein [Cupriavidus sp. AU9028]MBY4897072.1 HAMP domain-containing protein [Cupriavidus sp. AU9028]
MKLVGISRQLAFAMGAIALGVAALLVLTSFVFYYFAFRLWPGQYPQELAPTLAEWIWLTATTLAGVALAVLVAGHLAKRILLPLNSVAKAMRSVAAGDLTARAAATDRPLAEAAVLVEDFNRLAGELQRMTEERAFWNAAIAHELRTPVTVLRGRLQGLADGVFEPDQTQFRKLLGQIEGLGRLVEDLRAISLAESGHLDMRWQHVNLEPDIGDAADSFRSQSEAVGQTVSLELSSVRVWCDPIRIRQAVMALLDNARRYAVPGNITVTSGVNAGVYYIRVEDEGPGVAPDLAPHVFEAFRRAGEIRDRGERSSGLGLAVVAAIAHAHGGGALCRASASGGTAFEIQWPEERRATPDAERAI